MKIKYRKEILSSIFLISIIVVLPAYKLPAQTDTNNEMMKKKITIVSEELSAKQILEIISRKTAIPIGIVDLERIVPTISNKKISVRVRSGQVSEVLAQLKSQISELRWEEYKGILIISFSKLSSSFLNVRLKNFQLDNISICDLGSTILKRPELKYYLESIEVEVAPVTEIIGGSQGQCESLSFSSNDISLKDLLVQVEDSKGLKSWSIFLGGSSNQYVALYFR